MKRGNQLALCVGLLVSMVSFSVVAATELVINGGFETGDLTGWSTSMLAPSGPCGTADNKQDWNVGSSGAATNCNDPGSPPSGSYAVYNMFDGGTDTPLTYRLWQQISLPSGNYIGANLSWQQAITWSFAGGTLPRVFSVDVYDAAGVVLLGNVTTTSVSPGDGSSGWVPESMDVRALLQNYAGQVVTLHFSVIISEPWTGPAGLGMDDVSLMMDVESTPVPTLSVTGITIMVILLAWVAVFRRRFFQL